MSLGLEIRLWTLRIVTTRAVDDMRSTALALQRLEDQRVAVV